MNYATDIREFNFYQDYLWAPNDFANLQLWLQSEMRATALARSGGNQSILQGCLPSAGGGLLVAVGAGVAIDSYGRVVSVQAGTVAVAEPIGNPCATLIVLRPTLTDMTQIPEPDSPLTNVPLHEGLTYELVALNGTPAANPVYPTPMANDIVVAGLQIPAGTTALTSAMFDWTQPSVAPAPVHNVDYLTAAGTITAQQDHVDLDGTAASFTVELPLAETVPGQDFTFCKVDNVNTVTVAAQGSDLISGQASWDLTDQWATLKVRSVGTGYRVV